VRWFSVFVVVYFSLYCLLVGLWSVAFGKRIGGDSLGVIKMVVGGELCVNVKSFNGI
jgi:hypothetical protein